MLQGTLFPEGSDAVSQFQGIGGRLTLFTLFGFDPLSDRMDLFRERDRQFCVHFPDISQVFHSICNDNCIPFQDCLKLFISLTEQLTPLEIKWKWMMPQDLNMIHTYCVRVCLCDV